MRELFASPYDGRAKLWIVYRLLNFRRRQRTLFDSGTYVPLKAIGDHGRHVLAFARVQGEHGIIAIAGRLFASITGVDWLPLGETVWRDTMLEAKVVPQGIVVTDLLSGTTMRRDRDGWPMARLFEHFPGVLLAW